MGTRVAPTYANLFMNSLEQTHTYPNAKCPRIGSGSLMTFGYFQRYGIRVKLICRIL